MMCEGVGTRGDLDGGYQDSEEESKNYNNCGMNE